LILSKSISPPLQKVMNMRPAEVKTLTCLLLILSMTGCVMSSGKSAPAQMRPAVTDVTTVQDIEVMKSAIRFKPDNTNKRWNRAAKYWADGDIEQTAAEMREYVELDPDSPDSAEAHNIIGIDHYSRGRYDDALDEFRLAVKLSPDVQQYSYNEALTLTRLNRYDEADRAFARAPELKEGEYLRQVYAELIQVNKAKRFYNNGCNAMENDEVSLAMGLFQKALEFNPDMMEAHVNLGVLYGMQEDRSKQISHLKAAVRLKPDMPDVRYDLGLAYYDARNYPRAREEFIRAVKLDPALRNAHFKLGMIFYKDEKFHEAAEKFETCLKLFSRWFEAHLNLGTCYLKIGKLEGAVKHFEEAVQLRPRSAEAHYYLGEAYIAVGEFDSAIALFEKALKIAPGYRQARMRLDELKDYQEDKYF